MIAQGTGYHGHVDLNLEAEKPPIHMNADSVALVGASRVSLDLVLDYYEMGVPPEAIARKLDTLELADVYAAIAFYLRHTDEVEAYLSDRRRRAREVREENERRFPPGELRQRLLQRQRQTTAR